MRLGTIAVREVLPAATTQITDKEIQESLWHYYYDVEKTVAYLLSKHTPKQKVVKKDNLKGKGGNVSGGLIFFTLAMGPGWAMLEENARGGFTFRIFLWAWNERISC
jgi:hypothetical protein